MLSRVYNVDLIIIPSLHRKQFLELPSIICKGQVEWLNKICDSAIIESKKDRGILIICESIEQTKLTADKLKEKKYQR